MRKATALLLALLALALASCGGGKQGEERQAVDTIPLMVTKVRQCSRLYTAEYQVRKIVTLDDRKRLEGTFMSQDFSLELPAGRRGGQRKAARKQAGDNTARSEGGTHVEQGGP